MHFIDIHTHLIPGLDDGPTTLDETLAMLRLAHADGTRKLVATPHMFLPPYNLVDPRVVNDAFARLVADLGQLRQKAENSFLGEMSLYLGSENYLSPEFLSALEEHRLVPLNGSRFLLIEFPPFLAFDMTVNAIRRILAAGYVPVLAHVERYPFFREMPQRLAGFLAMGCVAQLNGSSLTGSGGRRLSRFATALVQQGLVHVIASDGHGPNARRPLLGRAGRLLETMYPPEAVAVWLWENPGRVIKNENIVRDVLPRVGRRT